MNKAKRDTLKAQVLAEEKGAYRYKILSSTPILSTMSYKDLEASETDELILKDLRQSISTEIQKRQDNLMGNENENG